MTKIAITCRYFHPFIGGVETFSLSLAKSLAKKHEVHVFTTNVPENNCEYAEHRKMILL